MGQEMSGREFASRSAFCEQFVTLVNEHSDVIRQVIMSDEAHSELPGCVNEQNRSGANLNELHVKPLHSQRGTVWSEILAFGIIGPYFFEDEPGNAVTVTSDRYVHMVNEFLLQELRRLDMDIATFWFQQDGAIAHTARQSMNALRTVFEHRIISRHDDISWPARSVDLSACDFFPWGWLKSKVFQARPADLHNLKQRISDEINAIPPAMLLRVMESVLNRVHQS
jgi:hypothetical protein